MNFNFKLNYINYKMIKEMLISATENSPQHLLELSTYYLTSKIIKL